MPQLPFTFEDLTKANPFDSGSKDAARVSKEAGDQADPDQAMPGNAAQSFLRNKINQIKSAVSSKDGLIDFIS